LLKNNNLYKLTGVMKIKKHEINFNMEKRGITIKKPVNPNSVDLTRRERFCRLYDFKKVDRPVHWEAVAFWQETLEDWKSKGGLPPDMEINGNYGYPNSAVREHYHLEPFFGISGGLGFTMALSGPPVQTRVLKEDGNERVMENDLGKIWRVRTDGVSMPQWIRFPVESPADWAQKIKPRLNPRRHEYPGLENELLAGAGGTEPMGLWLVGLYAFWRGFWGEVNLAYAFYDYPDVLHDMAKTWLTMHCECVPYIFSRAAIDYVLFHEDMAFKNGPLIGPDLFDGFMAPYYRELFAHLKQCGQSRFMLDSDGNNGLVLERFAELGMNGLFPFEAAAGCDALEFRRRHPRFFVWGTIDKRVLLRTKEDVRREMLKKIPPLWEQGGFIPAIDHSVPPCSQENFEYFLELARELCR